MSNQIDVRAVFDEAYWFGHSAGMEDCRPMGGKGASVDECWEDSKAKTLAATTPSAAPAEPQAYVVRDVDTGMLRVFSTYYDADQFLIQYSSRMLKPQFLFCYEAPQTAPPPAGEVQVDAAPDKINAERYLYLRDVAHPDSDESGIAVTETHFNSWGKPYNLHRTGADLDKAVDESRLAANKAGVKGDAS